MVSYNEYIKGILEQVMASYNKISGLKDNPGDLDRMKKELLKILGLFRVILNKIETSKIESKEFKVLSSKLEYYMETFDFEREIEIMAQLYSEDSDRLKNMRYKILESFHEKKLNEKINDIIEKL